MVHMLYDPERCQSFLTLRTWSTPVHPFRRRISSARPWSVLGRQSTLRGCHATISDGVLRSHLTRWCPRSGRVPLSSYAGILLGPFGSFLAIMRPTRHIQSFFTFALCYSYVKMPCMYNVAYYAILLVAKFLLGNIWRKERFLDCLREAKKPN